MKCRRFHHFPVLIGIGILITIFSGCKRKTYTVQTETREVTSPKQIEPLSDALVKPLLYTNISGLEKLPVPQAKEKFISAVLPAVLVAKNEIETLSIQMVVLKDKENWDETDSAFFNEIKIRYKAKDIDDLIFRIGTMPNSIVLAQAAVESGWGQSRFFLEGNNLFGMWSFKANEPRMAAGRTRQGRRIYLRAYPDLSQSIIHYFEILGSSNAYRSLRKERQNTSDPLELLPHLKNFSERRTSYTNQLKEVILQNNLIMYDEYRIDPEYLVAN